MKEIIVKYNAFKKMVEYFSKYSSNKIPKEQWVESMGFLFCSVEGDYYIIEDAIGMTSGSELDVQLSPQSLANIAQMEREHDGDFIGGWWHTHPGLTPFFSETDIKNQVFYQTANPDGLGIVFDHSIIDEEYIGFQIFRLVHQFSEEVLEVPFQLQGFSKEGIQDCMQLLGIEQNVIDALKEKYGKDDISIKINFSKLGEPIVTDPIGDSEWVAMEAEELLENDKIIEAIKKYKTATMILENTEHVEEQAKYYHELIKLCLENNYLENAREELENFKTLKDKINQDTYESYYSQLLKLF